MSKKWHARWPMPISDATEPASTLAAVLGCVIIRVRRSCDTDCGRRWCVPGTVWLHESGESGSPTVSGAKAVCLNLISPRVLTGDHTQRCTDTCERWRTHVDARQRGALCVHVHACGDYGRRTDAAVAAVRRRRTLHMLNYMLLTLLPMGTIALPRRRPAMHRGVARILHWWLQKLSAVVRKTLLYWIKQALRRNKASFSLKKSTQSTVGGHGPIPLWLQPWQRNATRCAGCPTATQCVWMLPQCQPS